MKFPLLTSRLLALPLDADPSTTIWFTKPAKTYVESSVLGNGRLGTMDQGGIVLNESSKAFHQSLS